MLLPLAQVQELSRLWARNLVHYIYMAIPRTDKTAAIERVLTRNVEQVVDKDHLRSALRSGKKLRVKLGIDPTGAKVHIGRAVVIWKLREFQDLGHKIVLIIGDFTAQIGDASDKLAKRPFLTRADVKNNLKNYLPQIGKIIDLKKAEVRYNSEWLAKLNFREISELAENFTIRQMIERENFSNRWEKHEEISLREFMYPLMQGYDSVAVRADVELGGTDQLFNLMAGRKIQERYGQKAQDIMTTSMLSGLDGRKMSTSWGNVINVTDSPDEQFGKVMSMHDSEILNYYRFTTNLDEQAIRDLGEQMIAGKNPKEVKADLALRLVARYHGLPAATKAAQKWEMIFSKKERPADVPEMKVKKVPQDVMSAVDLAALLGRPSGAVRSNSEAWRLVEQGGFEYDGAVISVPREMVRVRNGAIVKLGKKHFFRIKY